MLFSQTSKHFFGFLVYFFFMATMGESVIDMSGEWFGDWGRGRERAAGGWRDGGMGESVIDMGDGERRVI